ncbi:MAG: hypothetical protein ACXQTQ_02360 [Candidatus Hecatellaceae archaeon]
MVVLPWMFGGRLCLKRDGRGYFRLYSRVNGRLEYVCYVGKDLSSLKVLRIEGKTYLQVGKRNPLLEVEPWDFKKAKFRPSFIESFIVLPRALVKAKRGWVEGTLWLIWTGRKRRQHNYGLYVVESRKPWHRWYIRSLTYQQAYQLETIKNNVHSLDTTQAPQTIKNYLKEKLNTETKLI